MGNKGFFWGEKWIVQALFLGTEPAWRVQCFLGVVVGDEVGNGWRTQHQIQVPVSLRIGWGINIVHFGGVSILEVPPSLGAPSLFSPKPHGSGAKWCELGKVALEDRVIPHEIPNCQRVLAERYVLADHINGWL